MGQERGRAIEAEEKRRKRTHSKTSRKIEHACDSRDMTGMTPHYLEKQIRTALRRMEE